MKHLLLVAALLAGAGCLDCQPLLEVRNCLDHQCDPSDDAVELDWTPQLAADWPELDAAMASTPPGDHHHNTWDEATEQALWDAFGVTGDEKELIVQHDDGRFRIRVLTCA
ncbi:MAG: hypothetical protein ACPHID_06615 [Thermoplasmatota archaeon]